MEFTAREDAVKTVEMTDSNSERSSTMGKCCQTALNASEKSFVKGNSTDLADFIVVL